MKNKLKNWWQFEKEDLDRKIRAYPKFRLLLFLSTVFGFAVSLFWFWEKSNLAPIKIIDLAVAGFFSRIQKPVLTAFFKFLTVLGTAQFIGLLFILTATILFLKKRKRAAIVMLVILLFSGLINIFFRNFLFGRFRPSGCISGILGIASCFSFPSGHALWSFYFYGLLDYLIFRFAPMSWKIFLLITFAIGLLIILIGVSRLYLGVHYFSDIIAGLFHGGVWLMLAILLIDILYSRMK